MVKKTNGRHRTFGILKEELTFDIGEHTFTAVSELDRRVYKQIADALKERSVEDDGESFLDAMVDNIETVLVEDSAKAFRELVESDYQISVTTISDLWQWLMGELNVIGVVGDADSEKK
jgi:hypothetical protein